LYGEELVSKETLEKAFAPYLQLSNYPEGYFSGYGWVVRPSQIEGGVDIYQHSGRYYGFRSMIMRVPQNKLTVISLSNAHEWPLWSAISNS
jgi:CubicO group peptidase (beta-lactamase class C family)